MAGRFEPARFRMEDGGDGETSSFQAISSSRLPAFLSWLRWPSKPVDKEDAVMECCNFLNAYTPGRM
ncbi:hypothetical protein Lalb_Chr15g0079631 [Lupinus albus]|uniref:Uncharacterized protein n=1 Tax=Lupinus albus TaxID=3870 RepID=A0A6A4PCZ6_LUPAL|nr:hypothetical protein Lalb_Chr15g0079631 [Lupinus albus]